jgi:outer membrane murein-binding lipoprotein Lpp
MTVGQWLNQTIRSAAARELVTTPNPPQGMGPPDPSGGGANQGGQTDNRPAPYSAAYRANPPASTNDPILENILNLTNRIERTEVKTDAAVAPLASQMKQLAGLVERCAEQVEQVKSQALGATAPVERAMQRLSERLEKIEASRKTSHDDKGRSIFSRDK